MDRKPVLKFDNDRMYILDEEKNRIFSKIMSKLTTYHKRNKREIEQLLNKECEVIFTVSFQEATNLEETKNG